MKKPKKVRGVHPIVAEIKVYLDKEGITIADFSCLLLDYLPDASRHTQGSGEEITCTRRWIVQNYRYFAGTNTPRKPRLLAMTNWLSDQKETAEV